MNNILNIGGFTFLKLLKKKILYGIFFINILSIYLIRSLDLFGIGAQPLVLVDSILILYEVFGFILILSITAGHIRKEIETRSIYLVLSKPTNKVEYLLGKITGIYLFFSIYTLITMAGVALFSWGALHEYAGYTLGAILFRNLYLFIFTALLVFFSIFLRPTIMVVVSLIAYIFSMISYDYVNMIMADSYPSWITTTVQFIKFILPNSEYLDLKLAVMQLADLHFLYILSALLYIFGYLFLLVFFAAWVFGKREF